MLFSKLFLLGRNSFLQVVPSCSPFTILGKKNHADTDCDAVCVGDVSHVTNKQIVL